MRQHRLEVYARESKPLLDYYRGRRDVSLDQRRAGARSVAKELAASIDAMVPVASETRSMIVCRSAAELRRLREVNQLVGHVLEQLREAVAPGVTTEELDALAEREIRAGGAVPAFKGYKGYPATICASVNEQVVHGIPSPKTVLSEGDIISIDLGAKMGGFYGDSAVTVGVGAYRRRRPRDLLRVTEESLWKAIEAVRPGARISDIGHAVQSHVEKFGFSVVREFVGHGIGSELHEEPQIPNYGEPGRGPRLAEGMVLAIEPMVNIGEAGVKVLRDGWTAVTSDRSLSAHFEHTVAVTIGRRGSALAAATQRAKEQNNEGTSVSQAHLR